MESGSTSKPAEKDAGEQAKPAAARERPGPWPPRIERFVAGTDHNPGDLKSWARRTGFNPNVSGEAASIISEDAAPSDLAAPPPPPHLPPPMPGKGRRVNGNYNKGIEIGAAQGPDGEPGKLKEKRRVGIEPPVAVAGLKVSTEPKSNGVVGNGAPAAPAAAVPAVSAEGVQKKDEDNKLLGEVEIDMFSDSQEPESPLAFPQPGLKCGLTDKPGYAKLILYGLQHYLSLAGSLVFIPIITVPLMGGTGEETATVISTMLLVTGLATIMHSYLGTRLPLVQGSSFVYLAPALVIINSDDFLNLREHRFRHTMRELQGALVIGSVFQMVLGYSGIMALILRLLNPVVVAPTVAAVGLAFFSLGFPQAGTCAEISIPLILLILIFTLYLRKVSVFGNHVFLVYAVPLSVAIVWAYAFFLTAGGAYNYKDCSPNIPTSNILLDSCQRHVSVMKHCRTDVSNAWRTADWVRVPYPFQWGAPTFHFRTCIVMIIASLVASVDSVGTYHKASLLVNLRAPTPGIVSRGIGLEGVTSLLAGLWGTGIGATTLTENVHTLEVTKMASRRAIECGSIALIVFSFFGKVGALLASIPLALAASVLCFTWALVLALGLSTLQYTRSASSRNILIVGFTLFISLSIPAYFQQYPPNSGLVLPGYLVPFAAASDGPVHIGNDGLNYALNALLSLNMVVALVVSFVLDNTVPGSKQERGVYIWSKSGVADVDSSALEVYSLPEKIRCFFRWAKCVGS